MYTVHFPIFRVYSHASGDWSTIAKDTALECLEVVEGDSLELTKSFVFKVTSIISKTEKHPLDEESVAPGKNNLENEDPEGDIIKPLSTGVMGLKKKRRELPDWMTANTTALKKAKTATSLPDALNQKYIENVRLINSGPTLNLGVQEAKEEIKKNGKVKAVSRPPFEISDEEEEADGTKLVSERLGNNAGEPMKQAMKKPTGFRKSPFEYCDEEEVKAPAGSSCLKFSEYAEYINLLGNPPAEGKGPSAQSSAKGDASLEKKKEPSTSTSQEDSFTFPVLITPEDVQDDDAKEAVGTRKMSTSDVKLAIAKRPSCAFGASCYRKNTAHRKDAAHPGDHDFKDIADQV